jgi:hypothetical protein
MQNETPERFEETEEYKKQNPLFPEFENIEDSKLKSSLSRLSELVEKSADNPAKELEIVHPADEKSLEWPFQVVANSSILIRSALFAATALNAPRRDCKQEIIATLEGGAKIIYTGESLNQLDAFVFECLMNHIKNLKTAEVSLTLYEICKLCRLTNSESNYYAVDDSIRRMVACALEIKKGKALFRGNLIAFNEYETDFEGQKLQGHHLFHFKLNPEIVRLFAIGMSYYDPQVLADLRKSPMASYLYRWFFSHEDPLPISVKKLTLLCGSKTKNKDKQKQNISEGLEKVKEKLPATEYVFTKGKDSQIVHVAQERNSEEHKERVKILKKAVAKKPKRTPKKAE